MQDVQLWGSHAGGAAVSALNSNKIKHWYSLHLSFQVRKRETGPYLVTCQSHRQDVAHYGATVSHPVGGAGEWCHVQSQAVQVSLWQDASAMSAATGSPPSCTRVAESSRSRWFPRPPSFIPSMCWTGSPRMRSWRWRGRRSRFNSL